MLRMKHSQNTDNVNLFYGAIFGSDFFFIALQLFCMLKLSAAVAMQFVFFFSGSGLYFTKKKKSAAILGG